MNEDTEVIVPDNSSGTSDTGNDAEGSEQIVVEDTETGESENSGTVEIVEVEPLNAAGLTQGQTHFFAIGVFAFLMFIYFVCQRGSYDGRRT